MNHLVFKLVWRARSYTMLCIRRTAWEWSTRCTWRTCRSRLRRWWATSWDVCKSPLQVSLGHCAFVLVHDVSCTHTPRLVWVTKIFFWYMMLVGMGTRIPVLVLVTELLFWCMMLVLTGTHTPELVWVTELFFWYMMLAGMGTHIPRLVWVTELLFWYLMLMCVLGGEGNMTSINVCWLLSWHIFDVCRRAAGSVLYRCRGSAGTATSPQLNVASQLRLCGTLLRPDGWAHWEALMFMIMTEEDDQW